MRWNRPKRFVLKGSRESFIYRRLQYQRVRRILFEALPNELSVRERVKQACMFAEEETNAFDQLWRISTRIKCGEFCNLFKSKEVKCKRVAESYRKFEKNGLQDEDFLHSMEFNLKKAGIDQQTANTVFQALDNAVHELEHVRFPSRLNGGQSTPVYFYDRQLYPLLENLCFGLRPAARILSELHLIRGITNEGKDPVGVIVQRIRNFRQ